MSTYQDIDLYSRDNKDGTPVTYYAASAIKNAMNQWINSKRGEYLMNPFAGGALDNFAFKTLNPENFMTLKMRLMTALMNEFSPEVTIQALNIIPDYENRITEIEVVYSIPNEGTTDALSLFLNTKFSTNSFEYEEVLYIEDNLLEFVTIKKPSISSSRLIYDYDLNSWKWNKYKLVNLLPTDSKFTDILIVCNGS